MLLNFVQISLNIFTIVDMMERAHRDLISSVMSSPGLLLPKALRSWARLDSTFLKHALVSLICFCMSLAKAVFLPIFSRMRNAKWFW
jgi:hypothetical protein